MSYQKAVLQDKENIDQDPIEDRYKSEAVTNSERKQRFSDEHLKTIAQTELSIAREQNRKLLLENSLLSKKNKELKSEIETLQAKLSEKEREAIEMSSLFDPQNLSRQPLDEGAKLAVSNGNNNPLLLKLAQEFEATKEKIAQENKDLRLNLMECQEELRMIEEAKLKLKLERDILHEKCSERLIETLDKENKELRADKSELTQRFRSLEGELSALKRENTEIKKLHEDLRTEYNQLEQKSNASTPIKIENKCFGTSAMTPKSEYYRSQEYRSVNRSDQKSQPDATAKKGNNTIGYDSKMKGEMEDNYRPSFGGELSEFSSAECRKLIIEVMEVFNLSSPWEIITAVKKTEKAIHAIPRMQNLLSEITGIVLEFAGHKKNFAQINHVIPILKSWLGVKKAHDKLAAFKEKVYDVIGVSGDLSEAQLLEHITITRKSVRGARPSATDSLASSTYNDKAPLLEHFARIFSIAPSVSVFRDMSSQLNDISHFLTLMKSKLDLDPNMRTEASLTYILKYVDIQNASKNKLDSFEKIRRLIGVRDSEVYPQIEELFNRSNVAYKYRSFASKTASLKCHPLHH